MDVSFSNASDSTTALAVGGPISRMWTVGPSPDGDARLKHLTPLEREGARYGYRQAGCPFGPGRKGLQTWLELRARGDGR